MTVIVAVARARASPMVRIVRPIRPFIAANGCSTAARIADFYAQMVQAGLYRAGEVDLAKVADFRFVNRGIGLPLKQQLQTEARSAPE